MPIVIVGLESLMHKLSIMGGNCMEALMDAVKGATLAAQASAKQNTPVDTGNLRDHNFVAWEGSAEKFTGRVYNNTPYAIFVELGTVKKAARPFMMRGLEENKETFENLARTYLTRAIKKLGV